MFAYCKNNPANLSDSTGYYGTWAIPNGLWGFVETTAAILGTIKTAVGAIVSSVNPIGAAFVVGAASAIFSKPKVLGNGTLTATEVEANSADEESGPYSDLEDHPSVGAGKDFTPTQKRKIIESNKARNGGEVKSDDPSDPFPNLVKPNKSTKGIKPPKNEWQIEHIVAKSKGGTNSYKNARVISLYLNRLKWDK